MFLVAAIITKLNGERLSTIKDEKQREKTKGRRMGAVRGGLGVEFAYYQLSVSASV